MTDDALDGTGHVHTTGHMQATRPLAGRREWTALGVLLLPLLLVSMDVSVLYFAVPFISADLHPTASQQLWILDIYGFVLAGLLLTMGSLGDRIGRRRLLLLGALGFGVASVCAAYAPTAGALIAARAALGVAGATLMPSTLALIRSMFRDDRQRSTAIAVWTAVLTAGVAIGPVLSGFLLEHFWWGSVFLINIPAMLLLLALGPVLLPEFRSAQPGRFDLTSSALWLAAVLPVIYAVKQWATTQGFSAAYPALILAGCGVGAVFLARQRRISNPMLDTALFRRRAYAGAVLGNTLAMFALVGNAVFLTQYLQSVLGMTPFVAALWSLAPSVLVGVAAPGAGPLSRRYDRAGVLTAGFGLAAAGFALLSLVTPGTSPALALVSAGVLSAGLVAVLTVVTEMAMSSVEPGKAGTAAAVLETGGEFGGALGIAVLGSIGAALYASTVAGALPPGLSPADAERARQTLAGALTVATGLPDGSGLVAAAREAFTAGMHGVALVAGVGMVLAAAGCLIALRGVGPVVAADRSPAE